MRDWLSEKICFFAFPNQKIKLKTKVIFVDARSRAIKTLPFSDRRLFEIRSAADSKKLGLANAQKGTSGICFIGEVKLREF